MTPSEASIRDGDLGYPPGAPRQDVFQKVSRVNVADQQFLGDFGLRRQLQNCSAKGLMRA
jgi:hypothetical protein